MDPSIASNSPFGPFTKDIDVHDSQIPCNPVQERVDGYAPQ